MSEKSKPISEMVRQGWAVQSYSTAMGSYGLIEHSFLMQRQGALKVVMVRSHFFGGGLDVQEMEV